MTRTDTARKYERLYQRTAIARPLDPAYPTNRAVLILLPVAALAGAVWALASGAGGAVSMALIAAAVAFGTWALARELAPDDNPAAFVAMALGLGSMGLWPKPSLALLFSTLMLVRIVNRTTGLTARVVDVVLVFGLVAWTAWSTASPLVLVVAALAFGFDAILAEPARRHAWAAAVALAGALALGLSTGLTTSELGGTAAWAVAVVVVLYLWLIVSTRRIDAPCDVTGEPNRPERIKAGMLVALLVAGQALVHGNGGIAMAAPLWATMAAVAVAGLRPRSKN